MLDVRKLNMLVELDRLGTIAAVAKSLSLTAPGISMQLATLERELGVKLTERQGRRIVVTPAGHLLARHGRGIIDMLTVAEMEATSLRDGSAGTYRIGAFPTGARAFMPAAWKIINETTDLIDLRLIEMEPSVSLAALAAGEIELAVAHSYSNMPAIDGPRLTVRTIATESVSLAVNDADLPAPVNSPVALADFAAHGWIVPSREWTCHDMVHRACDLAGFQPRTVAEATDFQVQLALVAAGAGVALIPQLGAETVPAGVAMLELDQPVYRHIILVSRKASSTDAGLRRIEDAIADVAATKVSTPTPA